MSVSEHTIVVFEPRPYWESILRWQLADQSMRVRPCRSWLELTSLFDCTLKPFPPQDDRLVNSPREVLAPVTSIVIDPSEQINSLLTWLTNRTLTKLIPVIVVCPDDCQDLEWTLRDAGIDAVLVGEISSRRLAQICCRRRENSPR